MFGTMQLPGSRLSDRSLYCIEFTLYCVQLWSCEGTLVELGHICPGVELMSGLC